MNNQVLSAENVVKAIAARPQGFLKPEFETTRPSKKSANKYMDNNIVLENGQKKRLGISWKMQPLTGGIKEPKDRKYGATIQFRGSSGALGNATVSIYTELKRLISEGIKNGTIKVKKDKSLFRSVLQTELESGETLDDPIIRFKLPFDDNGRPLFKIVRIIFIFSRP